MKAETWKAVKGFWDSSSKNNGRSGCGVVTCGVDRDGWVTIGKIAVPLKVGTGHGIRSDVCDLPTPFSKISDAVLSRNWCVRGRKDEE